MAFPHTTHDPEINEMDLGGAVQMNVKIEQELNFVVDDSRLFSDAQEAKKVSERTVVR